MHPQESLQFRQWPPNPAARAWGIHVVNAGHAVVPSGKTFPPKLYPQNHRGKEQGRVMPTFHLLYVASGLGEFETKPTGARRLGAGDLAILPPGMWHRYRPIFDTGWHEYWLEFDGDLARHWMDHEAFQKAGVVVHVGSCPPSFERIIDLLDQDRPGGDLILGALAAVTIAEVLAAITQERGTARPIQMAVREARDLLAQGHANPSIMSEFAERRNLSYSVFRRWFKAETGCSPRQFVLETKMNWAKEMLLSSDAPVRRIAGELGLDSVPYFTRIFKERHGLTPSAFRDSTRASMLNRRAASSDVTAVPARPPDGASLGIPRKTHENQGVPRSGDVGMPMESSGHRSFFRCLPENTATRAWGIHVVNAGHAIVPSGSQPVAQQRPPDQRQVALGRVLQTYQLLYVAAGQGEFESRGTGLLRLVAGDLVILHPGQWHRYRPAANAGWHEYWLQFGGDLARRWMDRKEFLEAGPVFHIGPCQPFLDRMIGLLEAWRPGTETILGAFVMEALAEILAVLGENRERTRPASLVAHKAQGLLARDPAAPKSMPNLAAQLHVSYSAFRRNFKIETGHSPRQFVVESRMKRARELLATTDLTVARIADELGFDSVHYFSRLFARKQGQAPSSFRWSARATRG